MKKVSKILSAVMIFMAMWTTVKAQNDSLKLIKAEDAIKGVKYEFLWKSDSGKIVQVMITSGISGSGNYKTPTMSYNFVGTGAWQFVRDSTYDSTSLNGLSIPSSICLDGWIKDSLGIHFNVGGIQCANVLEPLTDTIYWVGKPTPDSLGNLWGVLKGSANTAGKIYWRIHTDSTKVFNQYFKSYAFDSLSLPRGKFTYQVNLGSIPSGGNPRYVGAMLETQTGSVKTPVISTNIWLKNQPATADADSVVTDWDRITIWGNSVTYNQSTKIWCKYRIKNSSTWIVSDTVYVTASNSLQKFVLQIMNLQQKTWYETKIEAANATGGTSSIIQQWKTLEKPSVLSLNVDTVIADAVGKKLKMRISFSTPPNTAKMTVSAKVSTDRGFTVLQPASSKDYTNPTSSGYDWIEVSVDTPNCYFVTVSGYTLNSSSTLTGWIDSVNVSYVCVNSSTLRPFSVTMTLISKDTINQKVNVSIKSILTENTSASFALFKNGTTIDQWSIIQKDSNVTNKTVALDTGLNVVVIVGSDTRGISKTDTVKVYITPPVSKKLFAKSVFGSVVVDKNAKTVGFSIQYGLAGYNQASTWYTVAVKGTQISGSHDIRTIYADGTQSYVAQIDTGMTFLIWANISNQAGITGSDTIEITIKGSSVVINGIHQIKKEKIVSVYPNPTTNHFQISANGQNVFTLYDVHGKQVVKENFINVFQGERKDLPSGVYIYTLEDSDGLTTGRLILY